MKITEERRRQLSEQQARIDRELHEWIQQKIGEIPDLNPAVLAFTFLDQAALITVAETNMTLEAFITHVRAAWAGAEKLRKEALEELKNKETLGEEN